MSIEIINELQLGKSNQHTYAYCSKDAFSFVQRVLPIGGN
jgi:hypothetical protein